MAALRLIGIASIVPAVAVLAGALIGMPFGDNAAFVLATIAGTIGVLAMVHLTRQRGVLHPDRGRGATIGGLVGLALGISLAATAPAQAACLVGGALLIGFGTWAGSGGGTVS